MNNSLRDRPNVFAKFVALGQALISGVFKQQVGALMGVGGDTILGACATKTHCLRKFCPTLGRFSAQLYLIFANFSSVVGAAAPPVSCLLWLWKPPRHDEIWA